MRWLAALCAALPLVAAGAPAQAQRTDEDAMRSAEDGFGLSLGGDSVGIYSASSARGFSPSQAGNLRIEGLYFDLIGLQGSRVFSSTTMRVGLSAQSYPFPAPTGVADFQFRPIGPRIVTSVSLEYETPYGIRAPSLSLDAVGPIGPNTGFVIGVGLLRSAAQTGGHGNSLGWGALLNHRFAEDVEFTTFFMGSLRRGGEVPPLIFTAGAVVPPRVARNSFSGQTWAETNIYDMNAGATARARLSEHWEARIGLFRSGVSHPREYFLRYRDTRADGSATVEILAEEDKSTYSWSGEARAAGTYRSGRMEHVAYLSVRGKNAVRRFGGSQPRILGPGRLGVLTPYPEPTFSFGVQTRDEVHQGAAGASYIGKWADNAELSVGLQKAYYHRVFLQPAQARRVSDDRPWLYNATLAASPLKPLVVFASYTRGLEDSGVAPENAANRGEVMPPSLTEQTDAGVRYEVSPRLTLVADVFEITKPYFSLNAQNLFAPSGVTRHRGVELSVSNRPAEGLTIIGGLVLLKPRVLQSGSAAIGRIPPGRPSRSLRLNVQYGPATWRGFSINGGVDHQGPVYYDRLNTLKLAETTRFDVGVRYDFKVRDIDLSFRLQVLNLANTFRWQAAGDSNRLFANPSRQYFIRLIADL